MKVIKTVKNSSLAFVGVLAAGVTSAQAAPIADSFYVNGSVGYGIGYNNVRGTSGANDPTAPQDLATRGAVLGAALGYFPGFVSTHNMGLGIEANGAYSNQKGSVAYVSDVPAAASASLEAKNYFGAMLVGKYAFSPSAALLVKAGWTSAKWTANIIIANDIQSSSKTLNGLKLGLGSEFYLLDDTAITLGVSYSLYNKGSFNHKIANAVNSFQVKPRVLEANIGLSYFF